MILLLIVLLMPLGDYCQEGWCDFSALEDSGCGEADWTGAEGAVAYYDVDVKSLYEYEELDEEEEWIEACASDGRAESDCLRELNQLKEE